MDVNKISIRQKIGVDGEIVIPIQMNWDFDGRGDSLNYFEQNAIKEILNEEKDFETAMNNARTNLSQFENASKQLGINPNDIKEYKNSSLIKNKLYLS